MYYIQDKDGEILFDQFGMIKFDHFSDALIHLQRTTDASTFVSWGFDTYAVYKGKNITGTPPWLIKKL
jgi:hypothetical protein